MPEGEQKFNISEERLEELRRKHGEEMEEAEEKGMTSISEVSDSVEGVGEKPPLEPSHESSILIEEDEGTLSSRQKELLKISAYFNEQVVDKVFDVMREDREEDYDPEKDKEKIEEALRDLTLKYEDILEREEEYPAAREVIRKVRDYLSVADKEPQPITLVWRNITSRIEELNYLFMLKEAASSGEKQYVVRASQNLKNIIFRRIPEFVPAKSAKPEETEGPHIEKIDISLPKEKVIEWMEKLARIVVRKGTRDQISGADTIVIRGEEVKKLFGGSRIEIGASEEGYAYIAVLESEEDIGPQNVTVDEGGGIRSGAIWDEGKPETKEAVDRIKNIPPEKWQEFIELAINQAESYKPEEEEKRPS